jgi:DNA-binding GntR family transcriptional regulator
LDAFIEQMDLAAQKEDFEAYYRLNREFHSTIFSACPHSVITETLQRTWDQQPQFGLIFSMDREALAHSRAEHLDLVASLRTGSWARAEELARHHKYAVGRRLLRALGQPIPDLMREGE